LIKETAKHKKLASDVHFNQRSHSLVRGWFSAQTLGFWSALKLVGNVLRPSSSALEVSSFQHMDPKGSLSIVYQGEEENGLQVGFKIAEMADRIEGLLRSIGLVEGFSPLVYLTWSFQYQQYPLCRLRLWCLLWTPWFCECSCGRFYGQSPRSSSSSQREWH
jgi:uncharacterized protein YbcC (UPF0753/DUF2309 family)